MVFEKDYLNPIEAINMIGWPERSFISYDPDLPLKNNSDTFFRCQQTGHDGTFIFTLDCLQKLLLPIVNMKSYPKVAIKKVSGPIGSFRYTLSPIRHAKVFGCHINDVVRVGMRERFTLYVKTEFLDWEGDVLKQSE
tara:strand:+ start:590 stop:1000 length:411 start_codon:yes stop_codon:yes gene_type:complete